MKLEIGNLHVRDVVFGDGNAFEDGVLTIDKHKVVGIANESDGRDGFGQPLVVLDEKLKALVSCGNVGELIELPACKTVIGNLESLNRDGLSGSWGYDEVLGKSARDDGSIIMEDNNWFCGDCASGNSLKIMVDF